MVHEGEDHNIMNEVVAPAMPQPALPPQAQ